MPRSMPRSMPRLTAGWHVPPSLVLSGHVRPGMSAPAFAPRHLRNVTVAGFRLHGGRGACFGLRGSRFCRRCESPAPPVQPPTTFPIVCSEPARASSGAPVAAPNGHPPLRQPNRRQPCQRQKPPLRCRTTQNRPGRNRRGRNRRGRNRPGRNRPGPGRRPWPRHLRMIRPRQASWSLRSSVIARGAPFGDRLRRPRRPPIPGPSGRGRRPLPFGWPGRARSSSSRFCSGVATPSVRT